MKRIVLIIICFLSVLPAFSQLAQDKARLERERQEIQREIKQIQANYNTVRGRTKASLGQLTILQRKLELQNQYINNINKEIRLLSDDIYLSNQEITRLQRQMDTLKQQYAKSVVYAYKNTNSYDYLNFIFSANGFNDALKRVAYLKTYRTYRERQAETIKETQALIEDRKKQLLGKQSQKKSALQNQQQQHNELENQKKEKANVVAKLKAQEKDLSREIAIKRKRDNQLKGQLAAIVRNEIRRAREEEERRIAAARRKEAEERAANPETANTPAPATVTKKRTESYLTLNEGQRTLAASFERNRGGLPWPVDNGFVSIPFGTSKVGGLMMDNPGITISTPNSGVPVKAVFDGEVSAVSNLGDGMMVMIRHGKYFTVYSNLSSVSVGKGANIRTGQQIGLTAQADDGTGGQLDFMLMIESRNVNPQPWLR
ncbi:MAG TPA: peptidoglycan DD-metalloendopeptidase family protein [Flavisolibacter sp.]|nr:peptidoglycan DD-metalloendopeptidase family protein [Flavisolibacter sp.]